MRLDPEEFRAPGIGIVRVDVDVDEELVETVPVCEQCGCNLPAETFDPYEWRGYRVTFSVVTVEHCDLDDELDTSTESARCCEWCADELEEKFSAIRLARVEKARAA